MFNYVYICCSTVCVQISIAQRDPTPQQWCYFLAHWWCFALFVCMTQTWLKYRICRFSFFPLSLKRQVGVVITSFYPPNWVKYTLGMVTSHFSLHIKAKISKKKNQTTTQISMHHCSCIYQVSRKGPVWWCEEQKSPQRIESFYHGYLCSAWQMVQLCLTIWSIAVCLTVKWKEKKKLIQILR